jgi:hypothetical protein
MSSPTSDPGSLSGLHDIVAPPPAPWWPPAAGWEVFGLLFFIGGGLLVTALGLNWRRNAYRRAALRELGELEQTGARNPAAMTDLAELLKRVALAAYGREEVASLTGADWLQFLDRSATTTAFSVGPGKVLGDVYRGRPGTPSPELYEAVRSWIQHHRREASC